MSQVMLDNTIQFKHTMLANSNADEFARQEFVKSFKLHLASRISPPSWLGRLAVSRGFTH